MGLDDLLTEEDPEPVRPDVRRRRAVAVAAAAVLGAAAVGVGAGVVAGLVDGGSRSRVAQLPGPSSSASDEPPGSGGAPTATAPTAGATPTATPRPTASVDVPASGTDVGYVVGGSRTSGGPVVAELRFDRVQVLTGAEAEAAAERDGAEVTGDDYVVNDNPRLRTLQLLAGTTVTGDASFAAWAGDGRTGRHPRTVDELLRFVASAQGRETLFDVRYDRDGFVASLVERYQP